MEDVPLTGILLAGGRSTRMGTDKAALEVDGASLAQRALTVLRACCSHVVVAPGATRRLDQLDALQVADVTPDAGPLAGIAAGLGAAPTPLAAVLAVDHPFASAAVLRALARRWDGQVAVIPVVDGRLCPLHAVWDPRAAEELAARVRGGRRSVVGAAEDLGALVVGPEVWGELDPDARFARNVNRPADL